MHALIATLVGSLMLGACARESAEPAKAAVPPSPPAIGGAGPATNAGTILPARSNGPVDTGEVGGMRAKPAVATDNAAGNPPKR
jgi:hypothetical protein